MMISHEGLKGIIEFLLHNQNEFIVKHKQVEDQFDKIEDEMEEMRKLHKKFKELERYKRETLENHKKKLIEHDDRLQSMEVNHNELRTNNHREH